MRRMCHVCYKMVAFELTTLQGVCVDCIDKIMRALCSYPFPELMAKRILQLKNLAERSRGAAQ